MSARLAASLLNKLEHDRPMTFEQDINDKLRALSAAEVSAVLERYIDPPRFTALVVGDFRAASGTN